MTEITPDLVLRAYTIGFFPMAEHRTDTDIFWVCPEQRGIIPLDRVHVPRKLRHDLRHNPYRVSCDTDFEGVMRGCAAGTPKRPDTWINPKIVELFTELHRMGHAHSVEVWDDRALVGGLYGVAMGGAFFGESMFSRAENTSKIALIHLIARLKYSGFELLDTQFITKHLQQFGAVEIPQEEYLALLQKALAKIAVFYTAPDPQLDLVEALLQSTTVTS